MEDKNKRDHRLAASILASVDIESNFKLYSYRVIPPEIFIDKVKEICTLTLSEIRKMEETAAPIKVNDPQEIQVPSEEA